MKRCTVEHLIFTR